METNNEFILESIGSKVARILHKYYYEEPSLICDNGNGNVLTLDGVALRYDFLDTSEIEDRSEIEEQKLKFLNDTMDLFYEIQRFSAMYYESLQYDAPMNATPESLENTMNSMTLDET